jgi:hypothetical protein
MKAKWDTVRDPKLGNKKEPRWKGGKRQERAVMERNTPPLATTQRSA